MASLDTLANAIATFEGFYVSGSVAQRGNNPGNLRSGIGQTGVGANGYATFASSDDGWNALYNQLGLYAARGMTVGQMMNVYAPSSENDIDRSRGND